VRYLEITRKLLALGCQEKQRRSKGKGSHRKWFNPGNNRATTVPDWGSKDLKTGTVRGIIKQLGLDWEAFEKA
jgi:predicted RNA binding protein YcfA (HicA-like mRNA interferase family)